MAPPVRVRVRAKRHDRRNRCDATPRTMDGNGPKGWSRFMLSIWQRKLCDPARGIARGRLGRDGRRGRCLIFGTSQITINVFRSAFFTPKGPRIVRSERVGPRCVDGTEPISGNFSGYGAAFSSRSSRPGAVFSPNSTWLQGELIYDQKRGSRTYVPGPVGISRPFLGSSGPSSAG